MGISGLLDTSRKALNAQSAAIRVLGDNIANVNTPGYTRRRADMISTITPNEGGLEVGTGVDVQRVVRLADTFLNSELVARTGDRSKAEIQSEFLKRAESTFQLDDGTGKIGYQLEEFFGALQDLQASPASIPLRTQVIQNGQDLSNSINASYNSLAQLQREADDRIKITIADINRLSQSIAQANREIVNSEFGEQEALTLRDQRDSLMLQLGEKISFKSVENSSGEVTVYLPNGYALVNGSIYNGLNTSNSPTFAPPGGFPPGLDGQALSSIVYTVGGTTDVDLTNVIAGGSGELAGLLSLRGTQAVTDTSTFQANGKLVEYAGRIEGITRDLLVRFNAEYRGPDADTSAAGYTPSAFDLDGNNPAVFGLFSFTGAAAGNNFGDNDNDGIASNTDLDAIVTAGTVSNYSSKLVFNVTSERSFAAARDLDLATAASPYAQGDSSNLVALLQQKEATASFNVGTFSLSTTIDGLYSLTVSYVGGASARAQNDLAVYSDRESQIKELQQSFAGVNLDEEFAQLIKFQQAFQASSRLIKTGSDLTNEIMNLLG